MKHVLIVRHGNTFEPDEPPRRIGARSDVPLTLVGEAQAAQVAEWLLAQDLVPDRIFSGPLQRATRTAEIIENLLPGSMASRPAAWLDEVDYGCDEGRFEIEIVARIGRDALDRWDRWGIPAPGWQVSRDDRIAQCRAELRKLPARTSLLVTSNGAARFLLLALGLGSVVPSLKLRTGAIGALRISDDAALLLQWDVRPHECAQTTGSLSG